MDFFLKDFSDPKERKGRVVQFFNNQVIPFTSQLESSTIDLEIGCGHGHWINAYSQENKNTTTIGIDLISKRLEKAQAKKIRFDNQNLFFMKADAVEFLTFKPSNILFSNIFIFFPDPWPKNKHRKRRLIQSSFLKLLKSHTHVNSKIFFRTDHLDYFEWTKSHINLSNDWNLTDFHCPLEHESYFQGLLPSFSSLSASRL